MLSASLMRQTEELDPAPAKLVNVAKKADELGVAAAQVIARQTFSGWRITLSRIFLICLLTCSPCPAPFLCTSDLWVY